MVKLAYNLDDIKDFGYEPGRVRAKLKSITRKKSSKGKPMLVFEWSILTGDDKGSKISSYCSLQDNALSNLKQHLEALGEHGKVNKSSDALLGKIAVLVLAEQESNRPGGGTFVGVARVLPKNASLVDDDDEDEEEDEEDEEYDEDEEDEEDEEDWEEDEEEDEDEEEEEAPRRRPTRSTKSRKSRKR